MWSRSYEIGQDGEHLARWEPSWWRSGGTFDLGGQRYSVQAHVWRNQYTLLDAAGRTVATADRVGRRRWTVTASGYAYQFRRASIWRFDQELVHGNRVTGAIRVTSLWRSSVAADLPDLPVPIQVFVLCVVLAMWAAGDVSAGAG